jgi:hypothetical protein
MTITAPQLLQMTNAELDALYGSAEPGPIPEGATDGQAIIAPGTEFSPTIASLVNHFAWQGKVFNPKTGELLNRILPTGWNAVAAKVYAGESWFDHKPCIVIDYSKTSLLAHWIRDEIRLIAPDLYLGRVYWDSRALIHFSLDFTAQR